LAAAVAQQQWQVDPCFNIAVAGTIMRIYLDAAQAISCAPPRGCSATADRVDHA
jgi:hypothetical protein